MATTAKKTIARPSRPKAQVQQEFSEIRKQTAEDAASADAKLAAVEREREAEIRQAVQDLTGDDVVRNISGLGLEITKTLGEISRKLVDEVNRLAAVREAVDLERKDLERLHKIDVAATALDQMVQEYNREKERLDAEIAAQRSVWEEQSTATERERREQEEALKKQRQREVEDYEYKKALERKKAQDKYDEEIRVQERKNQEKQETLEKNWQMRETAMKEREEELARLRKESEQFPARLQKEIDAASARARTETQRQFEQQIALQKKDGEADQRLAQVQIKTLEETVARQTAQLQDLQKQLNEAKQQVQDIAVKAIEGASGSRALAHVNQIAMEQAKQRSGQS